MKRRAAATLAALLCAAGAAAQQGGGPPGPPPFVLMGGEAAFERQTVRGVPYSATTETELVQTLADGNRIRNRWTGFVARDGAGRIRREQPLGAIGPLMAAPGSPRITLIHDPVQRVTLFLEPETKTARRMPWADDGERGGGRVPPFERGQPPGLPPGSDTTPPATELLGTREIAGVSAQGTRSTFVIAAGQIGNELPLSIVSERWTSDELGAVLESRYSDPRTGETRFRVRGIERREPDRTLFEVPADYAVEEGRPPLGGPRRPRRR